MALKNRKTIYFILFFFVLSGFIISTGFSSPQIYNPQNPVFKVLDDLDPENFSSNLPIIVIDTHGQTIVDPVRVEVDMQIVYDSTGQRNYLNAPHYNYNGQVGIELRGSTALRFPKQPYRFETHDSLGNDMNVSLLGLPKENDWVLHNPFSDKTFIRNVLAFKIARDMGRYASRSRLCELFLNGDYQGVYVLLEKIKRDKNRVDISNLDSTDVEGDQLTGGYIIKIDKTEGGEQQGGWISKNKIQYLYHYPKPDEILPVQEQYIQDVMEKFESVMSSPGFADPDTGYAKYIDVNSFVDFVIVSEITRNIDAYRLSTFMYKDRDTKGGKLTMGPVWDFNLAFGNANYFYAWRTDGWNLEVLLANESGDAFTVPYWWGVLGNDPAFLQKISERWWELRKDQLNSDNLMDYIDSLADTLDEAQRRNYQRWPDVLGYRVWPNFFIGEYYEEEVQFVKEWLLGRIKWMDENLAVEQYVTNVTENQLTHPVEFSLAQNYPNPFNSQTVIQYELDKPAFTFISIYNLLGQKVRTLIDGCYTTGKHSVIWNGTSDNGLPCPSGIYTYQIRVGNRSIMRKMVLIE
ncbi:CotH kinase family protein [candidate division KSB1 bacterium]|nr:CotH kinase family protein [candidate division KSB1 bacterium]